MKKNAYKYLGALDPAKDKLILIPRTSHLNRVVEGLKGGEYWGIFGLRQIGKTTFLRQIRNRLINDSYHCVIINFEVSPQKKKNFYEWLMNTIVEEIPTNNDGVVIKKWESDEPDFQFMKFLENLRPEEKKKKIVFAFDEVECIRFVKEFLLIWRKTYIDRDQRKELNRYAIVITGSANLIKLTKGQSSPFNVAKYLYMTDFSEEESRKLIDKPFAKLGIKITPESKERLLSWVSGHPQLLQHACSILVETAFMNNNQILEKDIDNTIGRLLIENSSIDTLREDIERNKKLKELVENILKGEKYNYHPYKDFSIAGAGCIVKDQDDHCAIRNKVYEKFLKEYLNPKSINSGTEIIVHPVAGEDTGGKKPKRFSIIEEIGRGGMGIVFKAKDALLDRTVAIKKLDPLLMENINHFNKALKEAQTAASLKHPNIVTVHDIEKDEDGYMIIMEFIDGLDYDEILKKKKYLPLKEILWVGKNIMKALIHSHEKNIIHMDIKPKNVMKDRDGCIKIVDFGIAALSQKYEVEGTRYIGGTPYFISPEQISREKLDARTDIYSSGATLFKLVTGKVPFNGKNRDEILRKHLYEPVPPIRPLRPDIPFDLIYIIEKCLEKDKEERYQNAQEVKDKIENLEKKLFGKSITANDIKDK